MRIFWATCEEPDCGEKLAIDGNRIVLAHVPFVKQVENRGWQYIADMRARCPKHHTRQS
jgi:hypothetical protein